MGIKYYAGNKITGLAGDTKPTSNIIDGSTFFVTDTEDLFMYDLGTTSWKVISGNTIAETLSSKTLTSPVINTSLSGTAFLDEDNFASDSATKVASQQSIKAYVASQVPGSQNVFSTIAVSGQDNVVADGATDTLTFAAGSNITLTTTAGSDTITVAASSSSATVTVTDNENTNENNLITFVANAATATGAHGLEMDGDLHYNPSTGRLTATQLTGTLQTAAQTNITSVGVLDGGSITSNFGSINTGASVITTTGLISGGSLDIDDVLINGTTIGHTDDTDLMTVASGLLTVAGEISVTTLDIGGTNVTSTAAEINIVDGGTSATGTTLADGDRLIVNDNGTMVQVALTDFETYFESVLDTLSNVTTVGVLNAGSITSGFGSIDVGASAITTTGTITAGDLSITGDTTTFNTATVTVEDPLITLASNNTGNVVDIGFYGKYRTNGTDLYTGLVWDGSASQYILFHANQAAPTTTVNTGGTGHVVSTLVANITGNISGSSGSATGNAATATALATGRTIAMTGDITWTSASFDGTGNVTAVSAIASDVIVNADVKSDAAIAYSKLATLSDGNILVGNGSNVATSVNPSGDIDVTNAGVFSIATGVIVNADINASAAIVDTKLATIATANKVGLAALDIDGGTEIGANIIDADLFIIDDGAGGTNRKTLASRLKTYIGTLGDANEYSFKTIVISGQTDVVADSDADTLTLAAGTGISLATSADTITITNSVTAGASESFAIAMAVAL